MRAFWFDGGVGEGAFDPFQDCLDDHFGHHNMGDHVDISLTPLFDIPDLCYVGLKLEGAGAGIDDPFDIVRREVTPGEIAALFGATVEPRAAPGEADLVALAATADVLLATCAPGVRLLSRKSIESLKGPKILADVNAVPPHGLEGVGPQDNGTEIAPGIFVVGALVVGDLKFKVESSLLRDLLSSESPPTIDLQAARRRALEIEEHR